MVTMHADVIELAEYHPWRRLVFFLVGFGACAAATLAYVYARPPHYVAISQLRIVPAGALTEPNPAARRVAFLTEVQVLTSRAVVQEAITRLKNAGALPVLGPDFAGAAQQMLHARPIGQTQVVELSAEGRETQFLTRLLDTVAESWRDRATRQYQQQIADENQDLITKTDDLHQQTMAARARLERFRDAHGILATDDEDALAADLQKLRAPYTAAQASLTKAKARMQASQSDPAVAELEQKAAALRGRLRDLERRYSPEDLKSDADGKNLLDQLAALDREIAARRKDLAGAQLQASQSHFERLSSDISVMKKIVANFVADRPQYDALQDDLDRAEKLEQAMLDQVAKSTADERERAPRLDILQAAQLAASPASPNYALNASIALIMSLGAGVLTALLSTLLDRPAISWTATGHRRYAGRAQARIGYRAGPSIKLLPAPDPD